jgi:hypothetical protein
MLFYATYLISCETRSQKKCGRKNNARAVAVVQPAALISKVGALQTLEAFSVLVSRTLRDVYPVKNQLVMFVS